MIWTVNQPEQMMEVKWKLLEKAAIMVDLLAIVCSMESGRYYYGRYESLVEPEGWVDW